MTLKPIDMARLVDMETPEAVRAEVLAILAMVAPDFDVSGVDLAFTDVLRLFRGRFPGYRRCNTKYHDLKHTTDAYLAMARLIHGATVAGQSFTAREIELGLIAALLHDTGYLQTADDLDGTGAKYTLTHVLRSVVFLRQYLASRAYVQADIEVCQSVLQCTGIELHLDQIRFESPRVEVLGKMLGAADLLGQMGDRAYLEKLPLLYREFAEGGVPGFDSELDLVLKTPDFFRMTRQRLTDHLGGVHRYMRDHFRSRWGIDRDLYLVAIDNKIRFLEDVLAAHGSDYATHLHRGSLLAEREKYYNPEVEDSATASPTSS